MADADRLDVCDVADVARDAIRKFAERQHLERDSSAVDSDDGVAAFRAARIDADDDARPADIHLTAAGDTTRLAVSGPAA